MSKVDIRWQQRLQNFSRALIQLENAVKLSQQRNLTDLGKQGLIQVFEFTHELCLNVMKDYFDYQGAAELITGSRDATKEAFNKGIIGQGETWMEMIKSRNKTSTDEIVKNILHSYFPLFIAFRKKMEELALK